MLSALTSSAPVMQHPAQLRSQSTNRALLQPSMSRRQASVTSRRRIASRCGGDVEENAPHRAGLPFARREAMLSATVLGLCAGCTTPRPAHAVGFKKELKKKKISPDEYYSGPEFDFKDATQPGLKLYDLADGSGDSVVKGNSITVHFDVKYRGLTVVSSREGRLLGGNRTIAEPFTLRAGKIPAEYSRVVRKNYFTGVGLKVGKDIQNDEFYVESVTKGTPAERAGLVRNDLLVAVDGKKVRGIPTADVGALLQGDEGTSVKLTILKQSATESVELELSREKYGVKQEARAFVPEQSNGLFTGAGGPKPPAALYVATLGMKKGGKRSVLVPAELGYGEDGYNEIPENAAVTMEIEILEIN